MNLSKERIEFLQKKIYKVLNNQENWNVKRIKFLSNGVVNAVFILEEESRGILIARTPWGLDESNEDVASLIKEATIAKHCFKHGLKVPKVVHLHLSKEISFLVSEYINGDDSFISAADIGHLVSSIHKIPFEGLSIVEQENKSFYHIVSSRIVDRVSTLNKFLSHEIKIPPLKEMETTLSMTNSDHCLIHLDIRTPNIIRYKGEIKAVIDWDNAFIGDPLMELMRILETGDIDIQEFQKGNGNNNFLTSSSRPNSIIYRLDTALMLAILFTTYIKDIDKGQHYIQRSHYLSNSLKRLF
ncbi:phosphotransferase family protein [Sutcliffiella rhizosphaerae]|uniref:Aminoglycoside phosphotransferase domain-containing protein n=1 Tax=Sutcliffiella rhizosphaerae TaxID=2880967 RepID=A0ABN8AIS9_9BACI|nr:phosphotransferase [Sutcliffiella rhizosphaerae]CAG9623637.1 hypothetical protein BACCIP111883_04455 [Sutcliffiella rhizosphaerae]